MKLDICLTPGEYTSEKYRDYAAVVIDVFRATSSMTAAFSNGCQAIIPVASVDSARERQQQTSALLAGERQALKIPGFQLGNSPREFTSAVVANKTIIMTTTNGTAALVKAAQSKLVFIAAFVNAAAVTRKLRELANDVVLVCAGREGEFSLEDSLCAGLLAQRLADVAELSDTAMFAKAAYEKTQARLLEEMRNSKHARYLAEVGYGEDVVWCLQQDVFPIVPYYQDGIVKV